MSPFTGMFILTMLLFAAAYMLPAFAGLLVIVGLLAAVFTGLLALAGGGKPKS